VTRARSARAQCSTERAAEAELDAAGTPRLCQSVISHEPNTPPPADPDPFRKARGVNAIFGGRKGPPLWPFFIAAIAILALVGLRIEVASREASQRDLDMQIAREMGERAHSDPLGLREPSVDAASIEQLTKSARAVCAKLATCNGGTADSSAADDCVKQNLKLASDSLSRSVMKSVLDDVSSTCGPKPCEEFNDCYFDRIKKLSGDVAPPGPAASEADKARIEELVCKVGLDYAGRPPPDLNAPDASPDVRELNALVNKIGPTAAADVMRDAVKHCVPGATPSASSGARRPLSPR
jgi:hypothetical protein